MNERDTRRCLLSALIKMLQIQPGRGSVRSEVTDVRRTRRLGRQLKPGARFLARLDTDVSLRRASDVRGKRRIVLV